MNVSPRSYSLTRITFSRKNFLLLRLPWGATWTTNFIILTLIQNCLLVQGNSCQDFDNCIDCSKASSTCHWCAFDNQCHMIGSPYGCITGVNCYLDKECIRQSPEDHGVPPPNYLYYGAVIAMLASLVACLSFIHYFIQQYALHNSKYITEADGHYQELALYNLESRSKSKEMVKSVNRADTYYLPLLQDDTSNRCMEEGKTDVEANITFTKDDNNMVYMKNKVKQQKESQHNDLYTNHKKIENRSQGSSTMYMNHDWGSTTNDNYKYDDYEKFRDLDDEDSEEYVNKTLSLMKEKQKRKDQNQLKTVPADDINIVKKKKSCNNDNKEAIIFTPYGTKKLNSKTSEEEDLDFGKWDWIPTNTRIETPTFPLLLVCISRITVIFLFTILIIAGILAYLWYPHYPVVNVCNNDVDWDSIIVGLGKMKLEVDYQILLSLYNPNRLDATITSANGVLKHDHTGIGTFEIPETLIKAGSITDVLVTLVFTPSVTKGLQLELELQQGTLMLMVDAHVSGYIKSMGMHLYTLSYSIANYFIHVGGQSTGRELCKCPDWN